MGLKDDPSVAWTIQDCNALAVCSYIIAPKWLSCSQHTPGLCGRIRVWADVEVRPASSIITSWVFLKLSLFLSYKEEPLTSQRVWWFTLANSEGTAGGSSPPSGHPLVLSLLLYMGMSHRSRSVGFHLVYFFWVFCWLTAWGLRSHLADNAVLSAAYIYALLSPWKNISSIGFLGFWRNLKILCAFQSPEDLILMQSNKMGLENLP